jgi:P27 family predicted phage terminase small subunit
MGTRGPNGKPKEIRELEHSVDRRKINSNAPNPTTLNCDAEPPEWMSSDCAWMNFDTFDVKEVARRIWILRLEELTRLKLVTKIDQDKFGRYCEMFARYLKAKAFIDSKGEVQPKVITSWDKKEKQLKKEVVDLKVSPYLTIYLKLADQLNKFESEFGIGASTRTRIISQITDETALKRAQAGEMPDDDDFDYAKQDGIGGLVN